MKIIIVGIGKVGSYANFCSENHDVVIIDTDGRTLNILINLMSAV